MKDLKQRRSTTTTGMNNMQTTPTTSSSRCKQATPSSNLLHQCIKCDSLLSPKDKLKHTTNACSCVQSDCPSDVGHGYILKDCLYAEVRDIDSRSEQKSPQDDVIFMNAVGMEFIQLSAGDAVQVKSSDGSRIWSCVAQPNYSLKNPCHICFSDDTIECEEGEIFVVEKITGHMTAKAISLESSARNSSSGIEVLIEIRKKLMNRLVFNGMEVKNDEEKFRLSIDKNRNNSNSDIADCLNQLSVDTSRSRFYRVNENTRITFPPRRKVTFNDVAGLDDEIRLMKKHLVTPILKEHLSQESRYQTAKSILIHGFTGTGKTLTVDAFIHEFSDLITCVKIDSATILSKTIDSTERKINAIFDFVIDQKPSICFFDRLDVLLSGKKLQTDQDKRLIACLLTNFDRINDAPGVFLVGITNQIDSLDSSLRGPDKFQLEIEFPIPMSKHRKAILHKLMSEGKHNVTASVVDDLSEKAFSFTGADLKAVVCNAFNDAIESDRAFISESDLIKAFQSVKPSAMREILLEVPCVRWSEIGGVASIRSKLEQMVIWPFKFPQHFASMGISPRKGILMYGPPGCSKTMIGKALATESNLNFISIKGPELFNKYVGESERAVRQIFKKAKQAAPSILFFDEIDALAPERSSSQSSCSSNNSVSDRVLAQLLTEMDGIESLSQVVIVAATNRPDKIDPALLRPGRLDSLIYVPLPDASSRQEIFAISTKKMPIATDIDISELVSQTAGYSGAEVTAICTEAGLSAMADFLTECEQKEKLKEGEKGEEEEEELCRSVKLMKVTMNHFRAAVSSIKARTSCELLRSFEQFQQSN